MRRSPKPSRSRSKSTLSNSLIIVLVLAGVLWLLPKMLTPLLGLALREVIPSLSSSAATLSASDPLFRFPATIEFRSVSASTSLPKSGMLTRAYHLIAEGAQAKVRPSSTGRWHVSVERITISMTPADHPDTNGAEPLTAYTVVINDLTAVVPVSVFPPDRFRQDLRSLKRAVEDLLRTGRGGIDLKGRGRILTRLEGVPIDLSFEVRARDGQAVLSLRREEIEALGELTEEGLTAAEVDLLLAHPVKAPRLLAIQREASAAARARSAGSPGFPEDAYRHILWSFLLTRAYGGEFALEVTDAHEAGVNRIVETEADRAMDLNNNRLGVRYALQGVSESAIENKVLTDPAVIRNSGTRKIRS